jgi:hypothetical protein
LRLVADRHLHEIALVMENLVLSEDFGDGLVRRSDHQMSALAPTLIELRARQGRPAALAADAAHYLGVRTEERVDCGFGGVGEEAMTVDADQELVGGDAGAATGLAIELRQWRKARGLAADDRNRQRQAERAGAGDRLRRAAGRDPDRQGLLQRARIDALPVERLAMTAFPRHHGFGPDLKQEIELFREQLIVILEVIAEQRKGLDGRAATGHDLGATA